MEPQIKDYYNEFPDGINVIDKMNEEYNELYKNYNNLQQKYNSLKKTNKKLKKLKKKVISDVSEMKGVVAELLAMINQ